MMRDSGSATGSRDGAQAGSHAEDGSYCKTNSGRHARHAMSASARYLSQWTKVHWPLACLPGYTRGEDHEEETEYHRYYG
jgi:hypothetical protein